MIEAGQYFGKYRLIQRIATGGMAEIFQAAVTGVDGIDRMVVIKRLHKHLSEDAELVRMLVDEARISVMLDHPNIGQVFDLGNINGQYYIVMAFIEGMDVHDILDAMKKRREFLPVPAALHMIGETCKGLHHAHTLSGPDGRPLGIVHRDVSPQNIMVGFDGIVRIVDFGIAKARMRAQTTQAGVIKGKFYYMAPEQAHGHHVDARTDVYSAGMVLYEMLAARSPYDDVADAELLRAVRAANIPPVSVFRRDVDPRLEQIVMTALQRDPNLRFPSAQIFGAAIEEYAHYTYPPVNHREQMAHFVNNVAGRRPPEIAPKMDRQQFLASDGSMIFARPSDDMLRGGLPGSNDGFESTRGDLPSHRGNQPAPNGMQPRQGLAGGFDAQFEADPRLVPDFQKLPQPPPDRRPFQSAERPVVASATASATNIAQAISSPKFIGAAVILIVALLAVVIGISSMGGESETPEVVNAPEPAAAVPVEAIVALAVNSIPANAMVLVDGEEKGSTPVSIDVKTGKSYRLEIVRHGFKTHLQDVHVKSMAEPIEVMLEEEEGVLKIASYPSEAQVKVDNREVGKTPFNFTGLIPDKKYLVEATLGDKKLSKEVQWKKGDSSVIDVLFEFEKGMPAPLVAASEESPAGLKRPKPAPRRTTRPARKPKSEDKSLTLWDDSSKKEEKVEKEEEVEQLNIFGNSAKKKTEKKPSKPKEEEPLKLF
jgi:serine/threonine-protein kinase